MRFFENVAKRIFNDEGIPILEGHVAYSPEEAMTISSEMNIPVLCRWLLQTCAIGQETLFKEGKEKTTCRQRQKFK